MKALPFPQLLFSPSPTVSLSVELLVQEENEQVDVNFSLVKHLHDSNAFVLQLKEVLDG